MILKMARRRTLERSLALSTAALVGVLTLATLVLVHSRVAGVLRQGLDQLKVCEFQRYLHPLVGNSNFHQSFHLQCDKVSGDTSLNRQVLEIVQLCLCLILHPIPKTVQPLFRESGILDDFAGHGILEDQVSSRPDGIKRFQIGAGWDSRRIVRGLDLRRCGRRNQQRGRNEHPSKISANQMDGPM